VLTTARALGEFGAVAVVSGNIAGRTQTLPLYVQSSYENSGSGTGAYAGAVLLAALAILTLVAMTMVRPRPETHGNRSS
jgi:sulfate transport system permease protein